MKQGAKKQYYILRAEGKTQAAAAAALGVSERTCRRWEAETKKQQQQEIEDAQAQYISQKQSIKDAYTKLENAMLAIDFDNLAPEKILDLLLKYGRRLDELEAQAPTMPTLHGLAETDAQSANTAILEMQETLFNMAAEGKISDEQARKKIALLSELRKSATTANIF